MSQSTSVSAILDGESLSLRALLPAEDGKDPNLTMARRIYGYLDRKYLDYAANVTRIFGRTDLHFAVDLTHCSQLAFNFQGKPVERGWVEGLCVGDTRTGKSTLIKRLIAHLGYATMITGENCSYAGLVGGIDDSGSIRFVRWGAYPQNDKRMLVVDEIQELSPEIITHLSNVRSSGIAEIMKIRQMRTHARVRAFWIANPRHNQRLSTFPYGCESIFEIIGKPEDIARLDFALSAAADDVPSALYDMCTEDFPQVEHKHTKEWAHKHTRWCWSRTADEIVWMPGAETAVVEYAARLANEYSQELPLVIHAEQKIKLARLTVAFAKLACSWDGVNDCICTVHAYHAAGAYYFLRVLFDKLSFGYNRYSAQRKLAIEAVKDALRGFGRRVIDMLLCTKMMSATAIRNVVPLDDARHIYGLLLRHGCLNITGDGTYKTAEFTTVLRALLQEEGLSEEGVQDDGTGSPRF
jgi:hypothetical protein